MPPKNSGGSTKFPGGHKVIHRTAQTAFVRVVTPRNRQVPDVPKELYIKARDELKPQERKDGLLTILKYFALVIGSKTLSIEDYLIKSLAVILYTAFLHMTANMLRGINPVERFVEDENFNRRVALLVRRYLVNITNQNASNNGDNDVRI